jgi:hypothetical protein
VVRLRTERDAFDRERTTVLGEVVQAEARLAELRRQVAAANPGNTSPADTAMPPSSGGER